VTFVLRRLQSYTQNSPIDHHELVLDPVRATRMYRAVCGEKLTASGDPVPTPVVFTYETGLVKPDRE
jgi:hypothetical protein